MTGEEIEAEWIAKVEALPVYRQLVKEIATLREQNTALLRVYKAADADTNPPPDVCTETQAFAHRIAMANELLVALGEARAVLEKKI